MTGAARLLDTSVVSALPTLTDGTYLPVTPFISAITLAELSVGPLVARTDAERSARQAVLQQAEADSTRCRLMRPLLGRSDGSRRRGARPAASPRLAATTR